MESGRGRRPYVVASCAMSVDGLIDDASDRRLVLSNDADLDRVDQVRAECDAILVGAETVRRDNPRLLVRSARRRRLRREEGRPDSPLKVTLTRSGDLDPAARFFTEGGAETLVYAASAAYTRTRDRLGSVTTVVDAGSSPEPDEVLADLWARGVRRLLVEGGERVHTAFLTADLVDELHLVIAPCFVGHADAPRFVGPGPFPHHPGRPMTLVEVRPIGDVALLRYRLGSGRDAAAGDQADR
ncbi:RibD family protein [Thermasporomyces composti]|jgi:5-amino-6-(5-phosphoribosylamino)uracil reductase|uniref:5-amino-6-(5-phosphoribosylamino)uracil reductase n=1 Tax=Thermasporomyces composti TaxID=696763 RepID=A0A3D9VI43_THECX|nr:RibD family protein [Thermasporomyces composti]REF37884.1 5-amino-6-(5-phosphoribosylamino)uracil reductase [Thermasporomyces composti]